MLDLHTRIRRNPGQIFTDMDGDVVMMDMEKGTYFGIGGVGSHIWTLLDEPKTVGELIEVIHAKYEVSEAQCQADILAFVNDLLAKGLAQLAP